MAIQKEIWAADIAENIFPSDSFVENSKDETMYCDGKRVTRANAGAKPTVVENRGSVPSVAVSRVDIATSYDLYEYTSDPTVIRDIEEIETTYNKRQDVLKDHYKAIQLMATMRCAYEWGATTSSNIIRTSGAAAPAKLPGTTGSRKKVTLQDFWDLKTYFDDLDIEEKNRFVLFPAYMYNQFVLDNRTELLSWDKTGKASYNDGNLKNLAGFNIYTRGKNNLVRYDNSATPARLPVTMATAATSNAAILAWHKDHVARARGDVKVYEKIDDPQYYGSIFSAMARAGGQKVYANELGVAAIVEI